MKRALLAGLALMLMMGLVTGCSDSGSESADDKADGDASSAEESSGQVTVETFEIWAVEQSGADTWFPNVSAAEMTTRFRKPTILVFVDMSSSEFQEYGNAVANEWGNTEYDDTTTLRLVSSDGLVFSSGAPAKMAYEDEVPPSPASADEFMAWLDEAYGPASGDPVDEEWYERIQGAMLNVDRDAIEVSTDLVQTSQADQELARVIGDVIVLAHPEGVTGWIVRYGDGNYERSSTFSQ